MITTLGITVLVHSQFRNFDTNCPKPVAHQTYELYFPAAKSGVLSHLVTTVKVKFPFPHTKIILLVETQIWKNPIGQVQLCE
jgi:hypothetical protein